VIDFRISLKARHETYRGLCAKRLFGKDVQDPINAVAELVWNSLDADADKVKIKLSEDDMGGLERMTITDNGQGLDYGLAEQAFGSLGGSWKNAERNLAG